MASSDSDYSDEVQVDFENQSDIEDEGTENESELSSDEHDDQDMDDEDYNQHSDYVDIEEEPLLKRDSRNI